MFVFKVNLPLALAVVILLVGTPSLSAQVDQLKDCSIWAWLTHNCAINPNGPCCHGSFRSAEQPGNAWHNNKETCLDRLEQTYNVCLDDDAYTRRSCDKSRREGQSFCDSVEKKQTARLSAGGATPTGGCSPWVWLTHNCAINPNGPCCHGNFRSAGKSGNAWHNDKEACLDRLEQAYDECVDDDDYTRRSCDQNQRKGQSFCDSVEKKRPARLSAGGATPTGGCSPWVWLTHNCAINPNGPCCHGNFRSAGKSGKAWHNDKEACLNRLEQAYDECVDDDDFTRRSCDQNRRKGVDFCGKIEQASTR